MTTLKINAKGQVTLTKDLLQHLNVVPGQKVEVNELPNGRLVVQSAKKTGSIDKFFGSLETKGGPRLTIAQIRKLQKTPGRVSDEYGASGRASSLGHHQMRFD